MLPAKPLCGLGSGGAGSTPIGGLGGLGDTGRFLSTETPPQRHRPESRAGRVGKPPETQGKRPQTLKTHRNSPKGLLHQSPYRTNHQPNQSRLNQTKSRAPDRPPEPTDRPARPAGPGLNRSLRVLTPNACTEIFTGWVGVVQGVLARKENIALRIFFDRPRIHVEVARVVSRA